MNQPTPPSPSGNPPAPPAASTPPSAPQPVYIHQVPPPKSRSWLVRLLVIALIASLFWGFSLQVAYQEYFSNVAGPPERFLSGDATAEDKIVVLRVNGVIMPPFTDRTIKAIKKAAKDDDVKGVVLSIDSPGGLVADSHQIYHELQKLREAGKTISVSMGRMAASGGYYIAMGAGPEAKIYAEPTTWTGSIGVIIPRYDATELAEKVGVTSDPLKTGPLKDALSPFRPLTDEEKAVWEHIIDDAFQRFIDVIAENRKTLDEDKVRELATGQIYTTEDARTNGLIDLVGFEEDAVEDLKAGLKLNKARVVTYEFAPTMLELLTMSIEARQPENRMQSLLDLTVPRAMYYYSWAPVTAAR